LAAWAVLVLLAAHGPAVAAACKLEKVAELPVTMQGTRPMVTVQVNGIDVSFFVNTGTAQTMISPQVAAQLHLDVGQRKTLTDFTGAVLGVSGAMVNLSVPGLIARNKRVGIADIGTTGFLGQDFLKIGDENDFQQPGDVEYDLAHGVIRLWRTSACGDHMLAYWAQDGDQIGDQIGDQNGDQNGDKSADPRVNTAQVSKINTDLGTRGPSGPFTTGHAYVNGSLGVALFDTGSPFSTLSVHLATRAGVGPGSPGVVAGCTGTGSRGQQFADWIAPVASFKIGKEEISHTHMCVGSVAAGMVLGVDFFLTHRIFIASREGELFFTANGTGEVFSVPAPPAN